MEKQPLSKSWMRPLAQEFEKEYMTYLKKFLKSEISKGKTVYPHGSQIFEAFLHVFFVFF